LHRSCHKSKHYGQTILKERKAVDIWCQNRPTMNMRTQTTVSFPRWNPNEMKSCRRNFRKVPTVLQHMKHIWEKLPVGNLDNTPPARDSRMKPVTCIRICPGTTLPHIPYTTNKQWTRSLYSGVSSLLARDRIPELRKQIRPHTPKTAGAICYSSAITRLTRVPMPSMVTETSSPGKSGPTPRGVPVSTTSPGRSVITDVMASRICGTENTI